MKSIHLRFAALVIAVLMISCAFFRDPKSQNDLQDLAKEEVSCLIAEYEAGASATEAIVSCALQTRTNILDIVKDLWRVYSAKKKSAMAARTHASTSASIAPLPSALAPATSASK